MLVIINDLSHLPTAHAEPAHVDQVLINLVTTLRRLRHQARDCALVSAQSLASIEIADGHRIGQWGERPANIERWRYLRRMQQRAPFRSVASELDSELLQYEHASRPAEGLGLAHALDTISVSLTVDPVWDAPAIQLTRFTLTETATGEELLSDPVEVRHASRPQHVEHHDAWLAHCDSDDCPTPSELWDRRESVLPRIVFLPQVEKQIKQLGRVEFLSVKEELFRLNRALLRWDPVVGTFPDWLSKVTPEAEQRKLLCQFADLDGVVRSFDLHARFTPGVGRIYFRLNFTSRGAVVAHIGRKLGV